jgi:hypothetical protein
MRPIMIALKTVQAILVLARIGKRAHSMDSWMEVTSSVSSLPALLMRRTVKIKNGPTSSHHRFATRQVNLG